MYLNLFTSKQKISIINFNSVLITTNLGYSKMLILSLINIINRKKRGKSIATYDFTTLCITLPHNKLIKRLCNVTEFSFEGRNRTHICISKNNVLYLGKSPKTMFWFQQKYIKNFFKTSYTKLLFYGWQFTNQTENRHPSGNWQISFYTCMKTNIFLNLFLMIK